VRQVKENGGSQYAHPNISTKSRQQLASNNTNNLNDPYKTNISNNPQNQNNANKPNTSDNNKITPKPLTTLIKLQP
jgi:hypothetical protein